MIAKTPTPPYFSVVFTSIKTNLDDGYDEMAKKMLNSAKDQEGFLGRESARNEIGITISYWKNFISKNWKIFM